MVYQQGHVLVRFTGFFGVGTAPGLDQWSVGLRMGAGGLEPVYDAGKMQTLVNSAHAAAKILHAATNMGTGVNCYLAQTTGAQIGVSGKYSPSTQQTVFSPVDVQAGIGSIGLPWNTALVYSLRTARPRGRCSNGRVYWPFTGGAVDGTTGRTTSVVQTARLSAFKTFINSLNTAGNAYFNGMGVIVASAVGGGDEARVTSVRCDQRLDSIERRENKQPAVWQSVSIP